MNNPTSRSFASWRTTPPTRPPHFLRVSLQPSLQRYFRAFFRAIALVAVVVPFAGWAGYGMAPLSAWDEPKSDQRNEWMVTTVAGTGEKEANGDSGRATEINLGWPFGVEIGPDGALYITEVWNHRLWRLDLQTEELRVIAGNGQRGYSGDGGPATEASLNEPYEVRFDREGNLYFVEMQNHLVRRVDGKTGIISTVAGTGEPGFSGDGAPATQARFLRPHAIDFDPQGGLLIADIGNHRIRRVDLNSGVVETIAGNGQVEPPREGALARESALPGPRAMAVSDDALWIVLREGHSVWRIDFADGRLGHVAGTGQSGYDGDGGPAKQATFNGPKGLAIDRDGNLLVVDSENDVVRLIDLESGEVHTVAGSGRAQTFGGDGGPALQAQFAQMHGICVADDGTIYLGDTLNHRVRRLHRSGEE